MPKTLFVLNDPPYGTEAIELRVGPQDLAPAPGRSMGAQMLKTTWTQREIDPKGIDMSKAVALFTWICADAMNPQGVAFYLEGVQFEGVR